MAKRCGQVAIIGRPNVGKSTLLNHILKQKLSITSRKPQTTRHQILGVKTIEETQLVYVDTPGIHPFKGRALNRYMNRSAISLIHDVDVIVWVVEAKWTEEEDYILKRVADSSVPVILAINKVDRIKNKRELLTVLRLYQQKMNFAHLVPISAKQLTNVEKLERLIEKFMPERPFMFDETALTNRPVRFFIAEIIREKLMRQLGQELPYALTVEIDLFDETTNPNLVRICATIYVDRDSQKPILIGHRGEKLKLIGKEARLDIKALIEKPVFLELWVKVKAGWADDERALRSLGYS